MKYCDEPIGNLDETPLSINIAPNYSISQKGKRSVIIRTKFTRKIPCNSTISNFSKWRKIASSFNY